METKLKTLDPGDLYNPLPRTKCASSNKFSIEQFRLEREAMAFGSINYK